MKKISIILPIYKVEKYLPKCLDSLVAQTLADIEIIAVNDGSPDGSAEIIKAYLEKYPDLISYYEKPNGGLSDARNFGLERAGGEYIAFIDSDDTVSPDFCEMLYAKAKSEDFDICACDIKYVFEDSHKSFDISSGFKKDYYSKSELKNNYTDFYPAAWNKLYKKSLLDKTGIRFKKGILFEDVEFWHRLYPHIDSLGIIKKPLYFYLQRDGAITSRSDLRLFDYISNFESIISYYKENSFFKEYEKELEYASVRYLYATFIKRAASLDTENFILARERARELIRKNFPNYRNNPYYKQSGIKGIYLKYCELLPDKLLKKILK